MDHNLEDSLTLEGDIASMEFDQSGEAVNQEEITLEETNQSGDIQMGLGHIEEQIIMDSGNEEVIVSDFINEDQFFQEYTIDNSTTNIRNAENIITQGGNIIQIQPVTTMTSSTQNFITLKARPSEVTGKDGKLNMMEVTLKQLRDKTATAAKSVRKAKQAPIPRQVAIAPRQVAIAPRPPHTPVNVQYANAPTPKPVALVINTASGTRQKVPLSNFVQGGVKGNTVLAQIGKQLVMIPANPTQKIKVMTSESGELAQLIPNTKGSKIVVTKLMQGQANTEASSKQIAPKLFTSSPAPHARYVMQQKTVPLAGKINLSATRAKVVLTSPVKQKVNVMNRKQVIAVNAQNTAISQGNIQTKKVYITKNPNQNVVLKASTTKTPQQVTLTTEQRTQLHPINVPGKGIQYIKLVTNQPQIPKQLTKVKPALVPKNFVITDGKGNIIQMSSDKVLSTQPPPLIMTTTTAQAKGAGTMKSSKKLVRIAPVGLKTVAKSTAPRSSQSLLAPIMTTIMEPDLTEDPSDVTETTVSLEEFNEMVEQSNLHSFTHDAEIHEDVGEETVHTEEVEENVHETTRLQSVTTDGDSEETDEHQDMNVESEEYVVEDFKPSVNETPQQHYTIEYEDTLQPMDQDDADVANNETVTSSSKQDDSNLIVIPRTASCHQLKQMLSDATNDMENSNNNMTAVSVEAEVVPYEAPYTPPPYIDHDNNMVVSTGLEVRPRKACNCTKSQCLKLYCDCFANGEFCNNCNCNNCHNNLENEELRQKAIRACLERNPNAFRPKIGKGKATGADLIRRHNKGCNCKRSGCLKNYCECYEAKIACTSMCKCVGCRNVEATLVRRDQIRMRDKLSDSTFRPPALNQSKQPCRFMTSEVIEAVCQCLVAAAGAGDAGGDSRDEPVKEADVDPVQDVIEEFARCLQDIINASYQAL